MRTLKKQIYQWTGMSLNSRKISTNTVVIFFRQLSTLVSAGIPLVQGCNILLQSETQENWRKCLTTLKYQLEIGKTLSSAFQKLPKIFDGMTTHLIFIGEHSGTLEKILLRIATHQEKSLTLKNKILQALLYPSLIFSVAILISLSMLLFIVPRFAELFDSLQGKLPAFTLAIIHLSHFLQKKIYFILAPLLAVPILLMLIKKSPTLRRKRDALLFKLPFWGKLLQKFILAKFTRTLATVFSAGIPITEALKMLKNLDHNHTYQSAIRILETHVLSGQHLHQAMHYCQFFPHLMRQMIKIGEESGALEQMLEKIAEFYEADIDRWVNNFSHLLEPLIIIILGVLIGGLVIAMYLPIFKLGTII